MERLDTDRLAPLIRSSEPIFLKLASDDQYGELVNYLSSLRPEEIPARAGFFLIFVGLFIRREVRQKWGLWPQLLERIGLIWMAPSNALYNAIEQEMVLQEIQLLREPSGRRLFVETFWKEVGITLATYEELLELFKWYKLEYYPKHQFDEALFWKWPRSQEFQEQKYLMIDSIRRLVFIFEALQDPDSPLFGTQVQAGELRTFLKNKLGFDPIRVLPTEDKIRSFYIRSLNTITPWCFAHLSAENPREKCIMPNGKVLWAHDLPSQQHLALGEYKLGTITYSLALHPQAPCERMILWPRSQVFQPFNGYVAYRSNRPFKISLGDRSEQPRELYADKRRLGYIWLSRVPVGQTLVIDGHEIPPQEGVVWQPMLRLWRPHYKSGTPPRLYIDITSLRINFNCAELTSTAEYAITIRCNDQIIAGDLSPAGNAWWRNLAFDLEGTETALQLTLTVGTTMIATRTLTVENAMLFNEADGLRVSHERALSSGGLFYLFYEAAMHLENIQGGTIENEWTWGRFRVYAIRRRIGSRFSISGDEDWQLYEREFLYASLIRPTDEKPDSDGQHNVYRNLTSWRLVGRTNVREQRQAALLVELLKGPDVLHSTRYLLPQGTDGEGPVSFVIDQNTLPANLQPGEYRVRLSLGDTNTIVTFTLVPSITQVFGTDETYLEGERVTLTAEWGGKYRQDIECIATLDPSGSRGRVSLAPRKIVQKVSLHNLGATPFPFVDEVVVMPYVFGMRFLETELIEGHEIESLISIVTRDDLVSGNVSVHFVGRPGSLVVIVHKNRVVATVPLNETGFARCSGLLLLPFIESFQTVFSACSEGLELPFEILWRPTLAEIILRRLENLVAVTLKGECPADLPLVTRVVDAYGQVQASEAIHPCFDRLDTVMLPVKSEHTCYVQTGYNEPSRHEFTVLHGGVRIPPAPKPCGNGMGISSLQALAAVRITSPISRIV